MRCESIYLSWETGRATEVYSDVRVRVVHNVAKYRCPTSARQQTDLETRGKIEMSNLIFDRELTMSSTT
jgi:hypothetical protein